MLVLGGNVKGGKIYGTWPGLPRLNSIGDLAVTTDYRQVCRKSSSPARRKESRAVFPTVKYAPLGLIKGS